MSIKRTSDRSAAGRYRDLHSTEEATSAAGLITGNTWANRGAVQDGVGQIVDEGGFFIGSDVIGEWVRPWIYNGTPVLHAKMTGLVDPELETIPLVNVESGGGTVTSDATHVLLDGTGAIGDTAYAKFTHGTTSANLFSMGLVTVSGLVDSFFNPFGRFSGMYDGVRIGQTGLALSVGTPYPRIIDSTPATITNSTNKASTGFATEALFEAYLIDEMYKVYHGAAANPILSTPYTTLTTNGSIKDFRLGDATGGAGALTKARQFFFGEC